MSPSELTAWPEPWGIYVHVPWCHRRCPYCDFYIEIGRSSAGYIEALLSECSARRVEWPKEPAQTLYLGGGTPSLLPAVELGRLLAGLEPDLGSGAEVTLEANPEDLNPDYLDSIRRSGINRLSLGLQSFDDSTLKWLGRKHRGNDSRQSVLLARAAGFTKISVDFIVGVPGESLAQIEREIAWLWEQGVGHVSTYILTVEEGTPLSKMIAQGRLPAPDEDQQATAYEQTQALLTQAGYVQYEVSSHAKPGQESRHNRLYWSKGSYLGLGPGAHSMRLTADGSVSRRHNCAVLAEWQKDPLKAPFTIELLDPKAALLEAIAFGLRDLGAGVNLDLLCARHHQSWPPGLDEVLKQLESSTWLVQSGPKVRLTSLGARFADAVAREILAL